MNLKKITLFFKRNINYLIIISVLLFFFAGSFGRSLLEMMRLLKLKSDLTQQIAQSEEESSQLDEDIAQIGTQSYIEGIARKYLELYYPNEQIVIPVENTLSEQAKENQKKRSKQGTNTTNGSSDQETDEDTTDQNQENSQDDTTNTDTQPQEEATESVDEPDQNEITQEQTPEEQEETLDEAESIDIEEENVE